MNNEEKVTELQRIISTAQDDLAKLMKQKSTRFKPQKGQGFWFVSQGSVVSLATWVIDTFCMNCYDNFNCYETEELATKASTMMRRSNAIIMACLQVDPDFVPDYLSGNQAHYAFSYSAPHMFRNGFRNGNWVRSPPSYIDNYGPCVSTIEKWEEAAALLKEWGIE
jgi:hypothetical protein